jgi:porin
VLAEQVVYRETDHPDHGLAIFGRYGIADSTVNQFDAYLGAGLVYTGLFPSRDEDEMGRAVAIARNGDGFMTAGAPLDYKEKVLELTYRAQITPWLSIQPDCQYVINPGTDPTLDNALVLALRVGLSF